MASSTVRGKRRHSKTAATGRAHSVKMRFEVQAHKVNVEAADKARARDSSYVMLSVGRKARVATTTPAVVEKSENGFSATWRDSDHLAMIVNIQPAGLDVDNDTQLAMGRKDFKVTLRHSIGEEKVMKTFANSVLDVSQIASQTSSKPERLTLDMKPIDSLKDEVTTVKLDISVLCQPLETVDSLPSTETGEDELSDIDVSSDHHDIELPDSCLSLPPDAIPSTLPPLVHIDYKPRNSPQSKKQPSWNAAGRGGGTDQNKRDGAFEFNGQYDPLGILTVQLIGASSLALPTNISTVCVYCVLTINGGLTTVRSPLCLYEPSSPSPIVWDRSQPLRFYTNRSRHLFVLCQYTSDSLSDANREEYRNIVDMEETGKTSAKDRCIGAASHSLMYVNVCSSCLIADDGTLSAAIVESKERDEVNDILIPLEPKGSVQINSRFYALPYRHPVSARGRLTITDAKDLLLEDASSVSCFVRIDGKQQGSTRPLDSEGDLTWTDEPIEFLLSNAVDVEIHLWSSKRAGTASWCAFGVLPLATCLYQTGSKRKPPRVEALDQCVPVSECDECVTQILLEPKGYLNIKLQLNPSQCPLLSPADETEAIVRGKAKKSLPHVGLSTEGKLQVVQPTFDSLVGRPMAEEQEEQDNRSAGKTVLWSDLTQLLKDRVELRQENDYLRETLTTVKADLASSEFQREKLAIQNRELKSQLQTERQKTLTLAQQTTKIELREAMAATITDKTQTE